MDRFGQSELSNVLLTDDQLRFDKSYPGRGDIIHYSFHRNGELWVGEYFGDLVGHGSANCIVTAIPEQMFQNL